MKQFFTPCLWYNNQAKEAAALYCSVFNDSKLASQSAIVSEIIVSGQKLILLDGGPMFKPNPSISFYYICEDETELSKIWKAFTKEGMILMALGKYPWGDRYGLVADKFGVTWQIALGKISDVGQKITSCFMFSGKEFGRVDEAIEHYSSVFKNTSVDGILRYGADAGETLKGKVQHVQLSVNGDKLMLMEDNTGRNFEFTEGVSLTVYCETQEEIDYYWTRLTEGGAESMCGWLRDRFGVSWQIIPTVLSKLLNDPDKAGKTVQAFMKMKKFDIQQLVQASM